MKLVKIEITGVTGLMQHAFHDEAAQAASGGSSSAVRSGHSGTPREQAEKFLYKDQHGTIIIPQPNLLRCLIDAGKYFKVGKTKVTTAQSSLIPGCVAVLGAGVPVIHPKNEPWRVHQSAVRNPSTGGRFLAYRPVFDSWQLRFEVELDDSIISAKIFREIVDCAGQRIGLGAFRPDRKGPFGRFKVTSWKFDELRTAEAAA